MHGRTSEGLISERPLQLQLGVNDHEKTKALVLFKIMSISFFINL